MGGGDGAPSSSLQSSTSSYSIRTEAKAGLGVSTGQRKETPREIIRLGGGPQSHPADRLLRNISLYYLLPAKMLISSNVCLLLL